jgi:hypothetical protein
MKTLNSGSWYICTLSQESFKNWDICKTVSAWGISAGLSKTNLERVKVGDNLIVYAARRGFLAKATVNNSIKRPTSRDEVPWAGGLYRYGALVPFEIEIELTKPLVIPFTKMIIDGTQIHSSRLQKGFSIISSTDGNYLLKKMLNYSNTEDRNHQN